MRDISKNIKQLRTRKGMTQDELAAVLFVTRQTVSNYETGKSRPDVDMLVNIAAALDTDVNTVIYGAPADEETRHTAVRFAITAAVAAIVVTVLLVLEHIIKQDYFAYRWMEALWFMRLTIYPAALFFVGWFVMDSLGILLRFKPFSQTWGKYVRRVLLILIACMVAVMLPYIVFTGICTADHIIGMIGAKVNGISMYDVVFPERTMGSIPIVTNIYWYIIQPVCFRYRTVFALLGAVLWVFGFPKKKSDRHAGDKIKAR